MAGVKLYIAYAPPPSHRADRLRAPRGQLDTAMPLRVLQRFPFGVTPTDPIAFTAVTLLLMTVGLLAAEPSTEFSDPALYQDAAADEFVETRPARSSTE